MKLFRPHPAISVAGRDEFGPLASLYGEVRAECAGSLPGELLASRYPTEDELRTWVTGGFEVYQAVFHGEVAGAFRCTFPSGACLLDALAVSPRHRGQGVGRALLEKGVTRARRAGMNRVWLHLLDGLDTETSLYAELGFRESGRLPRPAGPVLLLMERTL